MMTGIIGWSVDQFWRSTPHEVWSAWEAYKLANEVKDDD